MRLILENVNFFVYLKIACNMVFLQINASYDWLHFIKYFEEYMCGGLQLRILQHLNILFIAIFFKVNILHERIFCDQEAWHVLTVRRTMR